MSYIKANTTIIKARTGAKMLVTAESCTGGLVAAALTDIPGSSRAFDRGFVTYSNQSKTELLGVPEEVIAQFGAVSAQTACAMAIGALEHSRADIAVAVTGIAGPDGGTTEKPIGLVFFARCLRGEAPVPMERRFDPMSRQAIRNAAVEQALDLFLEALGA